MQKGTVLSLKHLRTTDFISKNNILILLLLLFITGIAIGVFAPEKIQVMYEYSKLYLDDFIAKRSGNTFISITVSSFMGSVLMLLLIFASGTSVLGVVLVPLLTLARAIIFGSVTSFLYSEYQIKGIAFNAILIIPSAIIFIISLLLAARESVKFSMLIAKITLPSTPAINLSFDFKNYCGRYIFICLIALASAITDAMLSHTFSAYLIL